MNESVKMLIKILVIGGIAHCGPNLAYDMGKGKVIGALARYNLSGKDAMNAISTILEDEDLSTGDRRKLEFILYVAKRITED